MAERRVALVIGNSAYKSVPRLTNPANDATLVGGMFKKAGFDNVDVRLDLNAADMRRSLREFAGRTRDAEVAVIYYAGHGIELDGDELPDPHGCRAGNGRRRSRRDRRARPGALCGGLQSSFASSFWTHAATIRSPRR